MKLRILKPQKQTVLMGRYRSCVRVASKFSKLPCPRILVLYRTDVEWKQ